MHHKQARRVVAGLDFSDAGDAALAQAFEILEGGAGELHVVHVAGLPFAPAGAEFGWEDPGASLADASEQLRKHVEPLLAAAEVRLAGRVMLHVRIGAPAEGIARLAAEVDADIIVIGTHGRRGVRRLLLGSVAEATVRLAGCPVLVVRPKDHAPLTQTGQAWQHDEVALSRP